MITFLMENMGTIVVLAILIVIVGAIAAKMIRDKKNGVHSCGCGCDGCGACGAAGNCHGGKKQ